jgi:hypothetical protein
MHEVEVIDVFGDIDNDDDADDKVQMVQLQAV